MKKSILVITVLVFSGLSVFASNPVAVARWSQNSRDLKNCNWKNGKRKTDSGYIGLKYPLLCFGKQ